MQPLLSVSAIEGIRIMDWDQIATVAQLVTGLATLAVAGLLVSQLRQQHRDSEREVLYTANRDLQDVIGRTLDAHFGPIWHRGSLDFDSLNPEEQAQFRRWCEMAMTTQSVNFRAGHEGLDRGIDSRVRAQAVGAMTMWPGVATYYERYGRSHTYDPDLRTVLDSVFHETQGREVELTWRWGLRETAS